MNQGSYIFFSHLPRSLGVVFAVAALLLQLVAHVQAEEQGLALEYRVKAVCIYNFTKYVRWPSISFVTPEDPMNVCFYGDNPFGNLFESASEKKSQNRPLVLVALKEKASLAEVSTCHLLFWTSKADTNIAPLLPQVENIGVLTVSDTRGMGIVSFFLEEGKVRFEINIEAAKKAGLAISSQLLKLAVVKEEGN